MRNLSPATYQLQRDSALVEPVTAGEYLGAAVVMGIGGALLGATAGLSLTVAGAILGAMSAGFLAPTGSVMAGAAVLGGALGAGFGVVETRDERDAYQSYGEVVTGTLRPKATPDGESDLTFFPYNHADKPVDLLEYSQAPTEPTTPNQKPWWNKDIHAHYSPVLRSN